MTYSLWLEFDRTSMRKLRERIGYIAGEYGTPRFEPHMTLLGDIDRPYEYVFLLAEQFAAHPLPIKIYIEGISTTPKYFMALYLSLRLPKRIIDLRQALSESINRDIDELDPPHISLAYGQLDANEIEMLINAINKEFVGHTIGVINISIVRSSKKTPISQWSVIKRIPFTIES